MFNYSDTAADPSPMAMVHSYTALADAKQAYTPTTGSLLFATSTMDMQQCATTSAYAAGVGGSLNGFGRHQRHQPQQDSVQMCSPPLASRSSICHLQSLQSAICAATATASASTVATSSKMSGYHQHQPSPPPCTGSANAKRFTVNNLLNLVGLAEYQRTHQGIITCGALCARH